jgi:tripartite-type tricarboxylate transporter receptor subunit TctC
MTFSRRTLLAAAGALTAAPATSLWAQAWPARPITVIEPFAAGGAVDAAVRAIAEKASATLGQPLVVDARPGGGTRIGTEAIRRAAPDGYTLGVMVSASGVNIPALDPRSTYDPVRDFTLLTLAFDANYVIVANASLGIRNMAELIDYARKNPGKLSYGSSGIGTSTHLWMEILQEQTRTQFVHVPYKGEAAAVQDLAGGHVQLLLTNASLIKGHVEAGRLNALAYASQRRAPLLPQVPTTVEQGLTDFIAGGWVAFIAPAGLPADVASRLTQALRGAINQPDVRARVEGLNFTVRGLPPEELTAQIRSEVDKLRAIGRARGITLND